MASTTKNYKFTLPATSENYSIIILNNNFTKIDDILKTIADSGGTAIIADDIVGEATTWSSKYISDKLSSVEVGDFEIPPAAVNVLGGIKPLASGSTNRSGLVIDADGTTYVNTNPVYGITRSGDGKIIIAPATQDEVTAGAEGYKPVTPATLKPELDRRGIYSATPVQIGTWIDGTPVWRVAFQVELPEDDTAWKDRGWTYAFNVKNLNDVIILNGQAFLYGGMPCFVDDIPCTYGTAGRWEFPENASVGQCEGIHGWIEFVTQESNIKS